MNLMTVKKAVCLLILITTGYFVYNPGISGGFIFDDFNNLNKLSVVNGDVSIDNLKRLLGESNAGPLKRPVSVFSFLLDAQTWPAEASPFKRTNIIIHLLNGCLLLLLLVKIFHLKGWDKNKALYVSFLGAGMWLFHPFLVSTTLYIVQRMAMLPLLFMLLGLNIYINVRSNQVTEKINLWCTMGLMLSVYVMTTLAVLSKENGVIFFWLLMLFEYFIIQKYLKIPPLSKKLKLLFLYIPSILLALALIVQIPSFIQGYDIRSFNMGERVMTQFRVITLYIYHLFVPDYFTEGVFTDGIVHSKSMINPLSTLFSGIFLLSLLMVAWLKRQKWVWFSFAVFFFFIAQIIESSVVNLELYYEHRVYVASVFIFIPFLLLFDHWSKYSKAMYVVSPLVLILMILMTTMRVGIWSNNLQLHQLTMEKFPESVRARVSTAVIYEQNGLIQEAVNILEDGSAIHGNLELEFNKLAVYCHLGTLTPKHINDLGNKLAKTPFYKNDQRPFVNLIRSIIEKKCLKGDANTSLTKIVEEGSKNINAETLQFKQVLLFMKGLIAIQNKDFESAEQFYIDSFENSKSEYSSMHLAIMKFVEVAEFERAQRILDYEKKVYDKEFKFKYDWLEIGLAINRYQEYIWEMQKKYETINHHTSQE